MINTCRFILVELECGDVGYFGERKFGEPREKPLEHGENQQQTQPTYMYGTGPKSNLTQSSQSHSSSHDVTLQAR